jgi:phospholipid/cholesterol/gamma-HCH transport system ATP-binding protein
MSARPFIRVAGLTVGWDRKVLLEDVSFEVARGDIFAILGGSGSGKSTLLRYLIGLERPMSGTVEIDGLGSPRLAVERPRLGVMFQSGGLFGSMTVFENIALPLVEWTSLSGEAIHAIVDAKLQLVNLCGAESKLPSELSGGMKKRAGIARAIALDTDLIFLDEPSAGLDPVTAVELDELILTLNRGLGLTVVLVTHELESIFKIAKQCIMLDQVSQRIIARGDPRALRDHSDNPIVRAFFNRQVPPPGGPDARRAG